MFRVITRKLVEQNRKMQEGLRSAIMTPGVPTPGIGLDGSGGHVEGYFDGFMGQRRGDPGGSFRVGRDRRSWFGVPVESYVDGGEQAGRGGEGGNGGGEGGVVKTRRKCC